VRVLELALTYRPTMGGVPYHVESLTRGLRARGHEVDVLTSTPGPAEPGVTRVSGKHWAIASAARRAVKSGAYDIVHAHDPYAAFLAARASIRGDGASVASIHDLWPACARGTHSKTTIGSSECDGRSPRACSECIGAPKWRVRGLDAYHDYAFRHLTSVVAVSEYVKRVLSPFHDATKVRVIHNWVDVDRFRRDEAGARRVRDAWGIGDRPFLFFMSRLIPEKGVQHLLGAMPALLEAEPNLVLVVGSKGWYKLPLELQAKALDLGEAVRFPGAIDEDDITGAYSACDLVVYPAVASETFSFVPLEGMSCGAAVLASTHGGTPEAMVHGESGWLVPPGSAEALAEAIPRLLRDAPLRARLGVNAEKHVRANFALESKITEYERHFETLLVCR